MFINLGKYKAKENFWNEHTVIYLFTIIRVLDLAKNGDSQTAVVVQEECVGRLPFTIACTNTYNPRVERSHLTNEVEFYQHENLYQAFIEQKQKLAKWEYIYNYVRPHQALGNLTPMAFYEL